MTSPRRQNDCGANPVPGQRRQGASASFPRFSLVAVRRVTVLQVVPPLPKRNHPRRPQVQVRTVRGRGARQRAAGAQVLQRGAGV
jgi:hypothetical protein